MSGHSARIAAGVSYSGHYLDALPVPSQPLSGPVRHHLVGAQTAAAPKAGRCGRGCRISHTKQRTVHYSPLAAVDMCQLQTINRARYSDVIR